MTEPDDNSVEVPDDFHPKGAFPFWIDSLKADTVGWSAEERWQYTELLAQMFREGGYVDLDFHKLAEIMGVNRARNWREKVEKIIYKCFSQPEKPGMLTHPKVLAEVERAWLNNKKTSPAREQRLKNRLCNIERNNLCPLPLKEVSKKEVSKKDSPSLVPPLDLDLDNSETPENQINDPLLNQLSLIDIDQKKDVGRGVSKKSKTTTGRRTQFPEHWELSDQLRSYAAIRGWDDDRIDLEFEAFRNHHQAHGSLMVRWDSAWRTWVTKGLGFEKQRKSNGSAEPRDREDETRRRRAGIVDALAGRLESADGSAGVGEGSEDDYPPGGRVP